MAWGTVAEKKVPVESDTPLGMVTDPEVVFVSYDDADRKFCHHTCEGSALLRVKIRTAHRMEPQALRHLVARSKAVVITMCRDSTIEGSSARKQELIAAVLAHAASKKIVLICSDEGQALQDHIAFARTKVSLVISPMRGEVADAFRDFFPHTPIIGRSKIVYDTPGAKAFFDDLAEHIRKLL